VHNLGYFVLIIVFIPYGWYMYTKLNNILYTFVE
jgi:cbb3-type cytochrome oxidase subunit 3